MVWVFDRAQFRSEGIWSAQIDATSAVQLTVYPYSYCSGQVYDRDPSWSHCQWWCITPSVFLPCVCLFSIDGSRSP